ncbi:motile sperm domain-containing protein 2-like [Periplaneta americana]|uniref:motile sperm domain-containing protein 2-like n=1 Tax=Periplaneta americana TaxID=6978 RepID=UPI0037E8177A
MEPTTQQIEDLRTRFLQKLENEGAPEPDGFHPADLNRVKNSEDWLRRFLLHTELDMQLALQLLWEACEWRKKFGTNDINESNVRLEYLQDGSFFAHNKDKDGKILLIFKSKKHVKGQRDMEDLKRCVVYWFERLERVGNGNQISIFFDMADTGMSNMDMDFTKYLIGLFKQYYPDFLNYILVFEMPWILNAAFKIIKSWLPAKAVQKIKFVNKSNLKDYVEPDQALKCWGGLDDYTFTFVPEQRAVVPNDRLDDSKKKVHFADGSPSVESYPTSFGDATKVDGALSLNSTLNINPPDVIYFSNKDDELTGSVTLTNNGEKIISYKIKTTSPEKFRVRPSTGTLVPSGSVTISVVLQPDFQFPGLSRDKFLVMNIPVDSADLTSQELTELWKQTSGKTVEQRRLRCSLSAPGAVRNGTAFGTTSTMDLDRQVAQLTSAVSRLSECQSRLHLEIRRTQKLQWLTIIVTLLVGVALVYFFGQDSQDFSGHMCFPEERLHTTNI